MYAKYAKLLLSKNPFIVVALSGLLLFSLCGTCDDEDDDEDEEDDPAGNPCEGAVGCEPID
jgi:hypothetical protein